MLSDDNVRALAIAMPFRHRWRHWRLLYSTARDGISLQTLYRYEGCSALKAAQQCSLRLKGFQRCYQPNGIHYLKWVIFGSCA